MSEKLTKEAILSGIEYYKALSEKYKKLKMEADYMKDGYEEMYLEYLAETLSLKLSEKFLKLTQEK